MTLDREVAGITIGTAGHIDHGKSALVRAITGTDPDRLPEEKERGITIDLGYATVTAGDDKAIGIIDVPGHEKFIKNMVAGATGMDLVLLVVAADDGVMPQTREHVEIMELLGVSRGFTAVTKTDLVDEEMVELVIEDVRDFVKGTFLEGKPIIPVSAQTGEGVEDVRKTLNEMLLHVPPHAAAGPFRMPIQRVFSAKGHGTVVTGVPETGQIKVGEAVEVLPKGYGGRIRRIQAYLSDVDVGKAGHRTALNISDISYKDIERGDVVCAPGYFQPAELVEGKLRYLGSARQPLESGTTVRFHTGCMETLGRCVLIDKDFVEPGGEAFCQIYLDNPTVVAPGDRFVIRTESPMMTVGGGVLFGRSRFRLKRKKDFVVETLTAKENALGDKKAFLEVILRERGVHPLEKKDLPGEIETDRKEAEKLVAGLESEGGVFTLSGGTLILHNVADWLAGAKIISVLEDYFRENPLRNFAARGELVKRTGLAEPVLDHALDASVASGELEVSLNAYNIAGRKVQLSDEMQRLIGRASELYREQKLSTMRPEEAAGEFGASAEKMNLVVDLLVERGELVRLKDGVLFHRDALADAAREVTEFIEHTGKMSPADFRTLASTTRKYAIPLLEHFDRTGLTKRVGDDRVLK